MIVTRRKRSFARDHLGIAAEASDGAARPGIGNALKNDTLDLTGLSRLTRGASATVLRDTKPARSKASHLYRVKDATERYSDSRPVGKHFRTGQPVSYLGKEVRRPSQTDYAKAGA